MYIGETLIFSRGIHLYEPGVFPHERLRGRMVFEREKLGRPKKLKLLQVSLTIQS
jgi:hypothetical protein